MSSGPKAKAVRLDMLLVERGLFPSREQAQRAILAGEVRSETRVLDKPGTKLPADAPLECAAKPKYVSRGGLKLEGALAAFGVDPTGRVCLDIGASTGGFTDCLLQHGATRVYAWDVGHSQLDWRIRSDPRVVAAEGVNCRHLTAADFPEPISLVVIDVSFISLTKILPAAADVLRDVPGAEIVALIKPQFELSREKIGKGGIVRDPAAHAEAVETVRAHCAATGLEWLGLIDSPITGTDGNREFLCRIRGSAKR